MSVLYLYASLDLKYYGSHILSQQMNISSLGFSPKIL